MVSSVTSVARKISRSVKPVPPAPLSRRDIRLSIIAWTKRRRCSHSVGLRAIVSAWSCCLRLCMLLSSLRLCRMPCGVGLCPAHHQLAPVATECLGGVEVPSHQRIHQPCLEVLVDVAGEQRAIIRRQPSSELRMDVSIRLLHDDHARPIRTGLPETGVLRKECRQTRPPFRLLAVWRSLCRLLHHTRYRDTLCLPAGPAGPACRPGTTARWPRNR